LGLFKERRDGGLSVEASDFFPVSVERILASHGWALEVVARLEAVGDSQYEQLGRCSPEERKIYLAADAASNEGERRFTLAHEAGHAMLGHPASRCGDLVGSFRVRAARRSGLGGLELVAVEQDADTFATELLMPEKAVRTHFKRLFSRDRLWVGSKVVASLPRSSFGGRPADKPYDVAGLLVRHRPEGQPSLCDFFGVSVSAMSRRLLELQLVHP
jgi:hypothetical protein